MIIRPYVIRIFNLFNSPNQTASGLWVSVTLTHLGGMSIIYFFLQTKHACPINAFIFDQPTTESYARLNRLMAGNR